MLLYVCGLHHSHTLAILSALACMPLLSNQSCSMPWCSQAEQREVFGPCPVKKIGTSWSLHVINVNKGLFSALLVRKTKKLLAHCIYFSISSPDARTMCYAAVT
jgi:hypothetical protein